LEILVGINSYLHSDFKVYPNPAREVLFIEGVSAKSEVVIRNILGELVKQTSLKASGNGEMSVSDLTPGIYFIYLKNEHFKSDVLKVIIQ
ncbi:MAG: T9SS type A sorting domain-containing protein, partial [Bacteroidales bacterium]|nr:T9SS type A sorting domain-containing protein [Bacteroidales bacterium]